LGFQLAAGGNTGRPERLPPSRLERERDLADEVDWDEIGLDAEMHPALLSRREVAPEDVVEDHHVHPEIAVPLAKISRVMQPVDGRRTDPFVYPFRRRKRDVRVLRRGGEIA